MSEIYYNDYFLDDQYQFLDGVDLHSPIYPVEDDQAVQAPPQAVQAPPQAFQFEDYLNLPGEEMQGNPTQVELPLPHITDNAAVNPQFFNQGFTGTMQPVQHVPAPFEFPPHYQNSVLNDFPDAAYPLHIIDQAGRLPRYVTAALLQGVKRRREFDDEILQFMASGIDTSEPFGFEQQPNKKRETSKGKGKALAISIEQDPEDPEDLALSDYEYDAENFALSDNEDEPESTQAAGPAPKERETPVRPIKVPGKKWIKPNATTQGKNKRSKNIQSMNPSRFYTPLAQPPRSWGTPNRAGVHPFQYTKDGELKPHVRYTVNQIQEFIFNHPGHTGQGQRHTKNSGLTLWVQSVPSDSAARYSHQNSDKCRFEDCPVRNGTIHKGHYRVAFDEQSSDPVVTDPFHNAGHVHLYCLEKFLDFSFICANFNVRPDYRIFPEGRNKMAITRDHLEMKKVVGKFIRHAEGNFASQGTTAPRHRYSYENTLSYALTAKALELEPRNRQKFRDSRPNANSIDKHLNNLDLFVAGLTNRKDKQVGGNASDSEAPLVRQPRMKNNKRKAAEVDEDDDAEFEVDETVLDADNDTVLVNTAGRAPQFKPSPRPVKKSRVEIKRNARKAIAISSDSSSDNDSGDDSDVSEWAPAVKRSRSR